MIRANYGGVDCFLLLARPNLATGYKASFTFLGRRYDSSTRRESRRSYSRTLRTQLSWRIDLERDQARQFRAGLRGLGRTAEGALAPLQPILCPFWPALRLWDDPATPFDGTALGVIFEPDWSRYQIYAGAPADYATTAASLTAPLLWGRFDKLPDPLEIDDERLSDTLSFKDTGPAAYALQSAAAVAAGPLWGGAAWPILPVVGQPGTSHTGAVDLRIDRRQIGYTRDEAESFYPQVPRRQVHADLMLDPDQLAMLVALWQHRIGTLRTLWLPLGASPCRLVADVAAGATTIALDSVAALEGHAHVFLDTRERWAAREIVEVEGDTLRFATAPGAFPLLGTSVQPLLFGRFDMDVLEISITKDTVTTTVDFVEQPPEYGLPDGETRGTTIGDLGVPCFLYTVTDGVMTWRATNFEATLTAGGHDFAPQKLEHGTISRQLEAGLPQATTCDLTVRHWPANPFARLRRPRRNLKLTVTIQRGQLADGSNAPSGLETIFVGRVNQASFDDAVISLTLNSWGALFDQSFPRPLVQRGCNSCVYDEACTLAVADWTFSARLIDAETAGAPFTYKFDTLSWRGGAALPAIGAHRFAFGCAERTLPDGSKQLYTIADSAALAAGVVELTLDCDLSPWPVGAETWALIPGCDGDDDSGCATFGNQINHSGMPRMPKGNPSIVKLTQDTASASKK